MHDTGLRTALPRRGWADFAVAELRLIEEPSPEHDVATEARLLLEEIKLGEAN